MNYSGSFEVSSPRDKAYAFATDPAKIITIFPDVQEAKILDAESFTLKVKVGLEFVKGVMDVKCVIAEKTPSTFVKLRMTGRGLASVVELESGFSLEDAPAGGTLVKWTANASFSGLMTKFGPRLIDSVASQYIEEIVESLKEKLSEAHAVTPATN